MTHNDKESENSSGEIIQQDGNLMQGPAHRVIKKVGGVRRLIALLKSAGYEISRAAVYKWLAPRSKGGTGGLIPTRSVRAVVESARLAGIYISPEDVAPW